mgnify:CR=1 FL=1
MVSDMDIYRFDLRGYLFLEEALTSDEVQELNDTLDKIPPMKPEEWYGYVQAHTYGDKTSGLNLQQIYEAGEPFEKLIDHPSWIEKVKHFVGAEGTFDNHHGPLFIDENLANFRERGEAIGIHSGGRGQGMGSQFLDPFGEKASGPAGPLLAAATNCFSARTNGGPAINGSIVL